MNMHVGSPRENAESISAPTESLPSPDAKTATSPPLAILPRPVDGEPDREKPTFAPASFNRRAMMNMMVGTALTGTALTPSLATASPPSVDDPIYEAIEAHRRLQHEIKEVCEEHAKLENILPKEKRQSSVTAWERSIVQSDDPQWIASELAVFDVFDREDSAAIELVNVLPTTVKGAVDLLRYVTGVERSNKFNCWPEIESEDGLPNWMACLHSNVVATFDKLAA